jgi:hypothetical protein
MPQDNPGDASPWVGGEGSKVDTTSRTYSPMPLYAAKPLLGGGIMHHSHVEWKWE